MTQKIKALAALADAPSSVPWTHVQQLKMPGLHQHLNIQTSKNIYIYPNVNK